MNFVSLPFYNIANMMFIGLQFCVGVFFLFPSGLEKINTIIQVHAASSFMMGVLTLAIVYEVGIVIDRLASMIIEKVLKSKKPKTQRGWFSRAFQITWKDYGEYQSAEKQNDAIKTLAREYNYSRNSLTMLLILTAFGICTGSWIFTIIVFDLAILFYMSMRKHANKISQRVDFVIRKENEKLKEKRLLLAKRARKRKRLKKSAPEPDDDDDDDDDD